MTTETTVNDGHAGVDSEELRQARTFTDGLGQMSVKTRIEWAVVGKVLNEAKSFYNGNTKKFGAWTTRHLPNLPPNQKSSAMKLANNYNEIAIWARVNAPDLNTPQHLVDKYQKANQCQLFADKAAISKVEAPEIKKVVIPNLHDENKSTTVYRPARPGEDHPEVRPVTGSNEPTTSTGSPVTDTPPDPVTIPAKNEEMGVTGIIESFETAWKSLRPVLIDENVRGKDLESLKRLLQSINATLRDCDIKYITDSKRKAA